MSVSERPYLDLQLNGYGGVDLNQDDLSPDDLYRMCLRLGDEHVQALGTIITEDLETMCGRLRRLNSLIDADSVARDVIVGLHIEGPFISAAKGFYGAHPLDAVRPADPEAMRRLLDAGGGRVRMVTLAPEQDPGSHVTRYLSGQRVAVSAGHTDATLDQLTAAIHAGLTMFTHLGNGCPMMMHRHDNIVQRALHFGDRLWLCFIADGVHVPFVALGNYLRLVGTERAIIVTDCMSAAGLGPGRFKMARWDVVIGDDMAARSPDGSHFLGAAITMPQTHRNLRERLGLAQAACAQLMVANPRRAIGL